jgi:hypothetical protein
MTLKCLKHLLSNKLVDVEIECADPGDPLRAQELIGAQRNRELPCR